MRIAIIKAVHPASVAGSAISRESVLIHIEPIVVVSSARLNFMVAQCSHNNCRLGKVLFGIEELYVIGFDIYFGLRV